MKRVLLIIAGGIAAYKSLEVIRRLRDRGIDVRCVMTQSAQEFVTPLSVAALSENKVYSELFSLTDEAEMGHIRLSREADLILVAPATANLMAKMASGQADDLATTVLLASDKPVMLAPAMNPQMWQHPATQANAETLKARGIDIVGPEAGDMACGEIGSGRLVEPDALVTAVIAKLSDGPLKGKTALVTAGPTHEPIDPVRYIANRSSGKQGYAIAETLARAGAQVVLISGPTSLAIPQGVTRVDVETAKDMLDATERALPCDVAIFAAAVADWRPADAATEKLKRRDGASPSIETAANPDILANVSGLPKKQRPALVIGFAAETEDVEANAKRKLARKGCDWLLANDVSPENGIFGGDRNRILFLDGQTIEPWPEASKADVAQQLVRRIAARL